MGDVAVEASSGQAAAEVDDVEIKEPCVSAMDLSNTRPVIHLYVGCLIC